MRERHAQLRAQPTPQQPQYQQPQQHYQQPQYEPRYDDRGGYQQPYRKKKKSFLSELFDD